MIFGWWKKKQQREHVKLVWQTFTASQRISATLRGLGDIEGSAVCDEFAQTTSSLGESAVEGVLPHETVQKLLDMNMGLRRTFDHLEANGPEARMRKAMGQPVTKRDFDDVFKPTMGWDELYRDNGL